MIKNTPGDQTDWRTMVSAASGVADLTGSDFVVNAPADVLELFAAGLQRFVLDERQLSDAFFDLSSGFAGELLQKCSNHQLRIGVVGHDHGARSLSFRQFAVESNRGGAFVFVGSVEEGLTRLAS
jgi:hypothetical protein